MDPAINRVDAAFAATPRVDFLPVEMRGQAALDQALPIGHDQTNSQPRTVRDMLLLLDVPAGARVLDVGSGSGWTTALLAHLVGRAGSVIGVEVVPELAERGAANLAALHRPWAEIGLANPAVLGRPDLAPFDRILVSAMATRIPDALVDQLTVGGVLVVPVAGRMVRLQRGPRRSRVERIGHYAFVPLIEPGAAPG